MRNIIVKELIQKPIEEQEVEIVERKGIGHPDSISDGIAESVSRALCLAYMEKFDGKIMHHNTDEVQITGPENRPPFWRWRDNKAHKSAHPFHPKSSRAAGPALFQVPLHEGPTIHALATHHVPLIALDRSGPDLDHSAFP